jgi:serine/threonine protein kinase
MGEVYRARDPRLRREVAVKVLSRHLLADQAQLRRFEHEARAAGALNHPNILAVFDIGTQDGVPYVVTELLEGETLKQRMECGTLSLRECLDAARQLAAGLATAHGKGIVHRDLKPANLFLTSDGRMKILDFGLAKQTAAAEDSTLTAGDTLPGTVMGTVGYMSPEQVQGQAADHRSDLFSFGAVVYEMLAGNRAFAGASAVETMIAILSQEPPALPAEREVPPAVEQLVRRCLSKDRAARPQHKPGAAGAAPCRRPRGLSPLPSRPLPLEQADRAAGRPPLLRAGDREGPRLRSRLRRPRRQLCLDGLHGLLPDAAAPGHAARQGRGTQSARDRPRAGRWLCVPRLGEDPL